MQNKAEKFCAAAIAGDLKAVGEMLKEDSVLANCRGSVREDHREFMRKNESESGWSPLHLAAHYGKLEVVKALIQSGADLNALSENGEGNTPLMAAVAGGSIEIVKELLQSGADPLKKDESGEFDSLKLARVDKKPEIAALIEGYVR